MLASGRRIAACAAVLTAAFLPPAGAQAQRGPSMDDALAAVEAYVPAAMEQQGTPGLSLAITLRDRTLLIVTRGFADTAADTPVTPQTRFAVGSITKSMTALALLQLAGEGKVDLNAPVRRYLPWFAIDSGGAPVRVRELLSHTGGLPDDFALSAGYEYDVAALRAARVLFAPGTAWSYSNDGYATLGAIVAQIDGRPWSASLQARVFDPLGMNDSAPYFTPQTLASAATGYQWRDNDRPGSLHPPLTASPPMDFVNPAGSVLSTPGDMARYMRLYLNGGTIDAGRRLISAAAFAAMTRPDRLLDGKAAGSPGVELPEAPAFYRQYGYGLSIFDDDGDRLIGHTGGVSGYTACMQMNLTRGFGVVAMANLVEAPLHPCAIVLYAMNVLRAQSENRALPSPPPAPDPARVSGAAAYAGTYVAPTGERLTVTARGDGLSMTDGTRASTLYPRGDDTFWSDDARFAQYLVAFGRDARKRVVELTYGEQWYPNDRYAGPRTFSHPAAWNGLTGRYENVFWGQPEINRVLIVKDRLTLDGVATLRPRKNGTFALGDSIVRFDTYAGARPTRMTIDGAALYRTELP
ncbi:MAG TPA: serine hydrolase [Candidatus Tumulicola sp.]|nr:serine hydrolase [Candidatus Tumulicola sp.]